MGQLATIGLDFGTAFTKAVVRYGPRDYAVEWDTVARIGDRYLMPSCFSEHDDGSVVLGTKRSRGWSARTGIKMALLQGDVDERTKDTAALFLAQAIRHIQRWTRDNVPLARGADIRWRVHLGLPSEQANGSVADGFRRIGSRAFRLASGSGVLRRDRLDRSTAHEPPVSVLPELTALMASYHRSRARQTDLHGIIDIGAATLDVAMFLDHQRADGDVVSVLARKVKPLGSHYLLSALVGLGNETADWHDQDALEADESIAAKAGCPAADVAARRYAYWGRVSGVFGETWREAYRHYRAGPVILGERPLRLFLSGGGGQGPGLTRTLERLERQFRRVHGLAGFNVTSIPAPSEERFVHDGADYSRLAVAHGLCEQAVNLGVVHWDPGLAPAPQGRPIGDRDADR